mgnify:FL=1
MSKTNRQFVLASRPSGYPKESDFNLIEAPVSNPSDGQLLIRTIFLSVDPYMRGRMNNNRGSYAPPVENGQVMTGGIVGEVVQSKNPNFKEGEIVQGNLGWQEYGISNGEELIKVNPDIAPISTALGILGMPGLTAYFGLFDICQPKAEETVLVSGAAGAVGSIVGQLAKIEGCRVVGIAGTDQKINYLLEGLGFDAAFNYKKTENYRHKLKKLVPQGTDVYFDNVGGEITDAVFPNLNLGARIAICGQISQYNLTEPQLGPRLFQYFIVKRIRMQGFLVFDFINRYQEGLQQMTKWLHSDKLKYHETIVEGFENTPTAFINMLKGGNIGKQLVKVSDL